MVYVYSFSNVGFLFCMPDRSAEETSFDWSMAEFQTAVYRKPAKFRG